MTNSYATALGWLERIKGYAPLAATLFGLLYAAGFVIVNSYLGGYGVKDPEAVRARYVGAGLVFLVFVAFALVIVDNVRLVWNEAPRAFRAPLVGLGLIGGPVALSAGEVLVLWRALSGPLGDREFLSVVDARLILSVYLMNVAISYSALLVGLLERVRAPAGPRRALRSLATIVLALVVVGVVLAYSAYVYPRIPGYLGGGLPSRVRLVVSQAVADACKPCVQADVLLIDAEGSRLVILADDGAGGEMAVEIFLLANADRVIIHRR